MLQSLDTLIAFVVIMTIVSLFVTIIVQMVSAALSLRGKNLANALALTFQTIDPTLSDSAHNLAARILSDPLLSDSTLTDKNRRTAVPVTRTKSWGLWGLRHGATKLANAIRPEEVYGALKNLAAGFEGWSDATITAKTALVAAQSALVLAKTPTEKATAMGNLLTAQSVLADCRMADSKALLDEIQKKGAEVRQKQRDLDDAIATQKRAQDALPDKERAVNNATEDAARQTAQEALAVAKQAVTDADPQISRAKGALISTQNQLDALNAKSLCGTAQKLLAGLGTPADAAKAAADKLAGLTALAGVIPGPSVAAFNTALSETSAHLVQLIDTEREKFDDWFSSAQDRAQQWFQLHTRGFTIVASILISFLFQLDAVEIYHYVSTNSTARAALVASADAAVKQSDSILGNNVTLIERINKALTPETERLTAEELKGVVNSTQLHDIVATKARTRGSFDEQAFNTTVNTVTNAYYKEQKDTIKDLTKEVSATGFDLIPTQGWRWPGITAPKDETVTDISIKVPAQIDHGQSFMNIRPHFFGILLFASLLTLGAPYWYNLLKTLSSLKPALAQLIGDEEVPKTQPKK